MMDKEYVINLTVSDITYLGTVLSKRPFKEVSIFIDKLNKQILKQDASAVTNAT